MEKSITTMTSDELKEATRMINRAKTKGQKDQKDTCECSGKCHGCSLWFCRRDELIGCVECGRVAWCFGCAQVPDGWSSDWKILCKYCRPIWAGDSFMHSVHKYPTCLSCFKLCKTIWYSENSQVFCKPCKLSRDASVVPCGLE